MKKTISIAMLLTIAVAFTSCMKDHIDKLNSETIDQNNISIGYSSLCNTISSGNIGIDFSDLGDENKTNCQTQYNNASSMCGMQYELDLQVADAFSSATGGLSFGSGLRSAASRRYGNCKQSAISAGDNCNSNGVK